MFVPQSNYQAAALGGALIVVFARRCKFISSGVSSASRQVPECIQGCEEMAAASLDPHGPVRLCWLLRMLTMYLGPDGVSGSRPSAFSHIHSRVP